MALHWLLGGRASFPIANVEDEPPGGAVTAIVVSAVLLAGAVAGLLSARSSSRRAPIGLVVATSTAALGTFGLAMSGVGIIATGSVERPFALLAQLFALVGALLLFGTTQVQLRRRRSRCPRCGGCHPVALRPDAPLVRGTARQASTRTRRTAYLVLLGLLPWASVKVVWGFGGSALGVTPDEWRVAMDDTDVSTLGRLLEHFGIDITVVASLVGVLLVLALLQRWGLYVPRWLVLLPAWIGGVSLPLYGVPLAVWGSLTLAGVTPASSDSEPFTPTGLAWMVLFGGAAFAGLGTALAIGARSYQRRSQPLCALP
ncbi:hypothetical protein GCM10009789_49080 [Kribbella sancticallisti]|uniref:Uncharacterized protein n=1 Tax=Kribbella sancticallisti TaxID=460087 RepID=A0ABN2DZC9_9ACTN